MATAKKVPARLPFTPRTVETLSAVDIGHTIRFYSWDAVREIATVITAELRQVNHDGSETHLTYGAHGERGRAFQHGEIVNISPDPGYSDVVELRQEMCDFHGITEDLL